MCIYVHVCVFLNNKLALDCVCYYPKWPQTGAELELEHIYDWDTIGMSF